MSIKKRNLESWKIGTNVDSYIYLFLENIGKNFSIGDEINFMEMGNILYVRSKKFKCKIATKKGKSSSKFLQIISSLLIFDIISFKDQQYKTISQKELISMNYVLNIFKKSDILENFVFKNNEILYEKNIKVLNSEISDDSHNGDGILNSPFKQYKPGKRGLFHYLDSFFGDNNFLSSEELTEKDKDEYRYWEMKELLIGESNKYYYDLNKIKNKYLYDGNPPPSAPKSEEFFKSDREFNLINANKSNNLIKSHIDDKLNISSSIFNIRSLFLFLGENNFGLEIPIMQRRYVWDERLIKRLIDDIFNIPQNGFHYFSSFIFKKGKKENTFFKILDGQQRFITMILLIISCMLIYRDYEFVKPKELLEVSNIIKRENKFIKVIRGNDEYDLLIKIFSFNWPTTKNIKDKDSNIYRQFCFIYGYVNKKLKLLNENISEKLNFFSSNVLLSSLFTITINNKENEFLIFENMNTLAKPLSEIDLIKNILLSFIKFEELENNLVTLQQKFSQKIEDFFFIKNTKKINDVKVRKYIEFFTSYFTSFLGKSLNNLSNLEKFRKIIMLENIPNNEDIKFGFKLNMKLTDFEESLDMLSKNIKIYINMSTLENYKNNSPTNILRFFSDILFSFNGRNVYYPLIFYILKEYLLDPNSSRNTFKKDKKKINILRKILFEIERFEVVLQVVKYRGRSLRSNIEKVINLLKLNGSLEKIDIIEMRNILFKSFNFMEKDDFLQIKRNLQKSSPLIPKMQPLLLNRINFYFLNDYKLELNDGSIDNFVENYSIEHIMPQTLEKSWKEDLSFEADNNQILESKHLKNLNTLGNLLIIGKENNSSLKNKPFIEKLKEYEKINLLKSPGVFLYGDNNLGFPKLVGMRNFRFSDIKKRTRKIADFINKIYKL